MITDTATPLPSPLSKFILKFMNTAQKLIYYKYYQINDILILTKYNYKIFLNSWVYSLQQYTSNVNICGYIITFIKSAIIISQYVYFILQNLAKTCTSYGWQTNKKNSTKLSMVFFLQFPMGNWYQETRLLWSNNSVYILSVTAPIDL